MHLIRLSVDSAFFTGGLLSFCCLVIFACVLGISVEVICRTIFVEHTCRNNARPRMMLIFSPKDFHFQP